MRQRGLTWSSPEQRAIEFRIAKHYLRSRSGTIAPAGSVLPTSRTYTDPTNNHLVALTYRFFIDSKGIIYAKAGAIDAGNYGAVTIAETMDGKRWAIKESVIRQDPPETRLVLTNLAKSESTISQDLDKSQNTFWVSERHQIIIYTYLGVSLDKYLEENKATLTNEERLALAVKLSRALYELHSGLASKTGKKYAHLDIKPKNITVDDNNNVHLIDFGFSEENPDAKYKRSSGTRKFFIPCDRIATHEKWEFDVFALLRTLYFPARYKQYRQTNLCDRTDELYNTCLLTDALVSGRHFFGNLTEIIAYGKAANDDKKLPTALTLHVELLLARYNLPYTTEGLSKEHLEAFAQNYHTLKQTRLFTLDYLKHAWRHSGQFQQDIIDAKAAIQLDDSSPAVINNDELLSLKIQEIWACRNASGNPEAQLLALQSKLAYRYLLYNTRKEDESFAVRLFGSASKSRSAKLESTIKMLETVTKLLSNTNLTIADLEFGAAGNEGTLSKLHIELLALLPQNATTNAYNILSNRS